MGSSRIQAPTSAAAASTATVRGPPSGPPGWSRRRTSRELYRARWRNARAKLPESASSECSDDASTRVGIRLFAHDLTRTCPPSRAAQSSLKACSGGCRSLRLAVRYPSTALACGLPAQVASPRDHFPIIVHRPPRPAPWPARHRRVCRAPAVPALNQHTPKRPNIQMFRSCKIDRRKGTCECPHGALDVEEHRTCRPAPIHVRCTVCAWRLSSYFVQFTFDRRPAVIGPLLCLPKLCNLLQFLC